MTLLRPRDSRAAPSARIDLPLLVQKYGGSSVATPERVQSVARRVVAAKRRGNAVVVVVSAMGKTTDELLRLSREINERPSRRELDMLLHAGEIISASLLAMAIDKEGEPAISFTGAQAGMSSRRGGSSSSPGSRA